MLLWFVLIICVSFRFLFFIVYSTKLTTKKTRVCTIHLII